MFDLLIFLFLLNEVLTLFFLQLFMNFSWEFFDFENHFATEFHIVDDLYRFDFS